MNTFKGMLPKYFVALTLAAGFFVSCNDDTKGDEGKEDLVETNDTVAGVINVGGELFSVPSPVQTAILVQKSGVGYDKAVLSEANKVNTFSTDFGRALNLGIYGADLGYVSLYNQTQDALSYLASIKQLSDKLGISAAFDGPTMNRIKSNITNKDSMMVLVGIAYRASDAYLKNNQRREISSLILAGGWVEGMHFSLAAYKAKPSNEIRFRIAEQKQGLTSLVRVLGQSTSKEAAELAAMLNDLAKVYEGIEMKYTFVEPTTDTTKKITYINSTTEINVTDQQIATIGDKIREIRNKIVNPTQS